MILNDQFKSLAEFGSRVVTLHTGVGGLRAGLSCECKAAPGDAPVMDFVASDATLDRYNEVVKPEGWELELFKANPVIVDCHDYSSITRILGRAVSVEVKDGRLVNRVEFCVDNPLGLLAWNMARTGHLKAQSVGFVPLEWLNGNGKDEPSRTYLRCSLLEISMVVVPANPAACCDGLVAAVKSGAVSRSELGAAVKMLSQICSQQAEPASAASASACWDDDAQWLQLARAFNNVLKPSER